MIVVVMNGREVGRFRADKICRVIVHGHAGNDRISIGNDWEDDDDGDGDHFTIPAWVYGDAGHDDLDGGSGHDVLIGGDGNDHLYGGGGRDLLIGGHGSDRLHGGPGDDILFASATQWDSNDTALCNIMEEWTSGRGYSTRVKNLRDGTGSTVRANESFFLSLATIVPEAGHEDKLTGASGRDWFFANYKGGRPLDKITDRASNESAEDLAS
jgi:Ca2+-binding RTX toxin-like protein